MRLAPLLALASLTALNAQDSAKSSPPGGHWNFGVIRQAPDLSGSYSKVGETTFDLEKDFALGKDTTGTGALIDYEGRRFMLHMATYSQNYAGRNTITRNVQIGDTTYSAGIKVASQVKVRDYELDWTIKVWRWDAAYLGVDLGFNGWNLQVDAQDVTDDPAITGLPGWTRQDPASKTITVPIPQVGASFGAHFGRYVDLRGYYHLLKRSGASYHRSGAEVRVYPLPWLGLRANVEDEGFDVPMDSIDTGTAFNLTKKGVGFGVVARF